MISPGTCSAQNVQDSAVSVEAVLWRISIASSFASAVVRDFNLATALGDLECED